MSAALAVEPALRQVAEDEGTEWARQRIDSLRLAGRAAAGGWPGTVSEARVRIDARLGVSFHRLSAAVSGEVVRVAYRAAQKYWVARASREPMI